MAAPYLKQIETESGIWFRDARKVTNQRRALSNDFGALTFGVFVKLERSS